MVETQLMQQEEKEVLVSPYGSQAYQILKFGFTVAPIIAGADKFTNILVHWSQYMAPVFTHIIPASLFMPFVGVVEILAGLSVAIQPRIGAYIVSAWLGCIVINLLCIPGYYDIALRDFGLALGALALG